MIYIYKEIAQWLLMIVIAKSFIGFVKSKWFSILLYFFNLIGSKRPYSYLLHSLENHKVYMSIRKIVNSELFLKYVKNKEYKKYMSVIIHANFANYEKRIKGLVNKHAINSLFTSTNSLVYELKKDIIEDRQISTCTILSYAEEGKINIKFARKYNIFMEVYYETLYNRIDDIKFSSSTIEALNMFLYILCDYVDVYIKTIPHYINEINGDVKYGTD